MSMDKAIRSVIQKYATFSGRASRSEYWFWILAFWIGWYIIVAFTHLFYIYDFGLLVPTLAVGVRRLHDTNPSGWWLVVPLVNLMFLISPPGEPNRYGPTTAIGSSASNFSTGTTDSTTAVAAAPHHSDRAVGANAVPSSTQTCPSCGTTREADQNFCRNCGTKFD